MRFIVFYTSGRLVVVVARALNRKSNVFLLPLPLPSQIDRRLYKHATSKKSRTADGDWIGLQCPASGVKVIVHVLELMERMHQLTANGN